MTSIPPSSFPAVTMAPVRAASPCRGSVASPSLPGWHARSRS